VFIDPRWKQVASSISSDVQLSALNFEGVGSDRAIHSSQSSLHPSGLVYIRTSVGIGRPQTALANTDHHNHAGRLDAIVELLLFNQAQS
jgi:hypothetical protein